MGDAFIALDSVAGFLFAAALAMVVFTHRELRAVRLLLLLCSIIFSLRWIYWAMLVNHPWWMRALVGAIVGSAILGGIPSLWKWSKEKEAASIEADHSTIAPAPTSVPPILHRHYSGSDRDRLSELLFTIYTYLNDNVSPPQLEIHRLSTAALTSQTAQRLGELRDKLSVAHRYLDDFAQANGYYRDEITDVLTVGDPLNADIVAINNYIDVILAEPPENDFYGRIAAFGDVGGAYFPPGVFPLSQSVMVRSLPLTVNLPSANSIA